MYSTSVHVGGLGLRPHDIGMVMGTWGAFNAVFQVLFFSKIMRWLGPRKMYIVCFSALLVTFSAFPILNMLAETTGSTNAMVWITVCFQMAFYTAVFMGYGTSSITFSWYSISHPSRLYPTVYHGRCSDPEFSWGCQCSGSDDELRDKNSGTFLRLITFLHLSPTAAFRGLFCIYPFTFNYINWGVHVFPTTASDAR